MDGSPKRAALWYRYSSQKGEGSFWVDSGGDRVCELLSSPTRPTARCEQSKLIRLAPVTLAASIDPAATDVPEVPRDLVGDVVVYHLSVFRATSKTPAPADGQPCPRSVAQLTRQRRRTSYRTHRVASAWRRLGTGLQGVFPFRCAVPSWKSQL
jgi:hypothetical protein